MALDLTLLGATGVQAVTKLINYTFNVSLDSAWLQISGVAGSPYQPQVQAVVGAVTTTDGTGHASPYTGSQTIIFNRVGFQKAFGGLGLKYNGIGPYTVGQIVQGIRDAYGIVIEQVDIQQPFSNPVTPDAQGQVQLQPAGGSLRFYIDNSIFQIIVGISSNTLTDLQKLVAMNKLADLATLNAQNTPPSHGLVPGTPIPDQAP